MFEFSSFAAALGVYVIGTASPGPGNLAIANTSLNYGRTPGLALAAGVISGSLCWGAMTAAGVSAMLMSNTQVLVWLKILGACYLFFLAWKSIRGALAHNVVIVERTQDKQTRNLGFYLQGLGIHLTNPKATLTWFTVTTVGLSASAPIWASFVLVASCAVLGGVIFCTYALAFSAHSAERFFTRTRKSFGLICAVFYSMVAIGFLSSLF
ncbi:LysE family translocator [Marinobacter sp. BSs20148]|jgi:threonine/homoserine/homoserine lactone efflux protein|uniref:LysE family translocator n=1 Tax=Marinobacter TaxID=2742 RepID=UPI00027772B3|nr:LysE family translocator [Marinobacter sp. BSs20148]AFP32768.1 putative membrane protein yahN [Marinobacter sp. BSs20148]